MSQSFSTTRRKFLTFLSYMGVGALGSVMAAPLNSCEDISTNSSSGHSLSSEPEAFTADTIVMVDAQGNIINRRPLPSLQTFTEDLGNGILLEMVSIPGGTFTMGSPSSEQQRNADKCPQRNVNVPPFYLGKYPLTQAQWEEVMGVNPSNAKGANRPVESVSGYLRWNFVRGFLKKAGRSIGYRVKQNGNMLVVLERRPPSILVKPSRRLW